MTNKQVVLETITGRFIRRDASVLDTHFAPDYIRYSSTRKRSPIIGSPLFDSAAVASS